eukprot:TRINITY_DN446_c0_g2_i1.p1 TRINITY_DN446_c0_g2~~TRINITY_DN446_c0_g2_i1.p1  ORF type:complete len:360 (+),score=77.51 TRINITY_DN446_c0_g2_i1:92-1171(+)
MAQKTVLVVASVSLSACAAFLAYRHFFSNQKRRKHFPNEIKILCGNANKKLASDVASILGTTVISAEVSKFADGELNIRINCPIRGDDVYIIQPTCGPRVNDNIMELLLLTHTCRLCSARRLTAVVPYFSYARQDRKTKPRVPISASAVAQLIESQRVDRVTTVELHCGQIQGFFQNTPVDNLFVEPVFGAYLRQKKFNPQEISIVSPDAGGVARARRLADQLQAASVVTILKREINHVEETQIVGDFAGQLCIIFDDMIDTAVELVHSAELLVKGGAKIVYVCATHGVFSEQALELINKSVIVEVCVTDTIPQEVNKQKCPKLQVLSIAPLLAETIKRLHMEESLEDIYSVYNNAFKD